MQNEIRGHTPNQAIDYVLHPEPRELAQRQIEERRLRKERTEQNGIEETPSKTGSSLKMWQQSFPICATTQLQDAVDYKSVSR